MHPYITHLGITWIFIRHGLVAPRFFYPGIVQRNNKKMTMKWPFSCADPEEGGGGGGGGRGYGPP